MRMVSCLADLDWNKSTQQFLRNLSSAASGSSGWGSGRSSRQDGGYGRQGYGGQSSYDRQTHNNQGVSWHTKANVHYLSQNFWTRKYYLIEGERTGHAQQPRPICSSLPTYYCIISSAFFRQIAAHFLTKPIHCKTMLICHPSRQPKVPVLANKK